MVHPSRAAGTVNAGWQTDAMSSDIEGPPWADHDTTPSH